MAMGVGAILAWLFSVWARLLRLLASREQMRQKRQQEQRIQALQEDVERYKAAIEQQHQLPPSAAIESEDTSAAEVLAG